MNFEQRLEEIRKRFRARASSEAMQFEGDWKHYLDGSPAAAAAIRERAHAIAGTAATLQFDAIAEAAKNLEDAIGQSADAERIGACIAVLMACLRAVATSD